MSDLYELRCASVSAPLRVLSFRGREALNEPYQFAVGVMVDDGDTVDLDAVVGQSASLVIVAPGHDQPQRFHGVIAMAEHVHQVQGAAVFELVLVPQLWRLTQTHHSRVFVDQSAPAIIEAILALNGIEKVRLALQGSYPAMPFVCQYRESDLAFITRWMEREGMCYFFEQGDDAETLVIADHGAAHSALGDRPVRFVPASAGDTGVGEALTYWRGRSRMLPATVTLRDYDCDNPKLDVRGAAPVLPEGRGEIHMHGQNFTSPAEGQRLAVIRSQELLAQRKVFHAHGRVFQLRPGYTFALEEHPRAPFNADYFVTELEHHGNQASASEAMRELLGVEHADEYRCDVTAVPASIQFRPERLTPWPRIYGTENAVVDGGASSDYAQMNDNGCYKVKIDFDESGLSGGGASCWMRMLQPHGGNNEGFHFPLRAGTEVLLTFLGGDPDQPVIGGVLPNALKTSPVGASNHTQNVLQSGGMNRLEMEDLDGKQHVRLNTPTENTVMHMGAPIEGYNVDIKTDGDAQWKSGRNYDVRVGGDNTKRVEGEVSRTYDKSEETHVKANRFSRVDGSYDKTIGGPQQTDVEGTVLKNYRNSYDKNITGLSQTFAGGGSVRTVGPGSVGSFAAAGYHEAILPSGDKVEDMKNNNVHVLGEDNKKVDETSTLELMKVQNATFHKGRIMKIDQELMVNVCGNVRHVNANGHEFKLGTGGSFDISIGAGLSCFVGPKMSLFGGVDVSANVAFKLSIDLSLSGNLFYSPKFSIGSAPELRKSVLKAEMVDFVTKSTALTLIKHSATVEDVGVETKDVKAYMKRVGVEITA